MIEMNYEHEKPEMFRFTCPICNWLSWSSMLEREPALAFRRSIPHGFAGFSTRAVEPPPAEWIERFRHKVLQALAYLTESGFMGIEDLSDDLKTIIKQADHRKEDGQWDVGLLDKTMVQVSKKKQVSAREATDKQFDAWVKQQLGRMDPTNRLRWRMFCVLSMSWLGGLKDTHFTGGGRD